MFKKRATFPFVLSPVEGRKSVKFEIQSNMAYQQRWFDRVTMADSGNGTLFVDTSG